MTATQGPRLAFVGNAAPGRFTAGVGTAGGDLESDRLRRDPGTGLLDQHGLSAKLQALTGGGDGISPRPFGVLLVNVESVLAIARNLGRDLYEHVVAAVAGVLRDAVGPDMVGRLSGEDFVVICPDLDDSQWSGEAHRIVSLLAGPVEVSGIPFDLDPAGGVALFPEHGTDFGTLVAKAEMAMSEGRRLGEPARLYRRQHLAVLQRRRDLLTDVHAMLRNPRREGELAVLYQPQVELAGDRFVGVEALVRWTHPDWGAISAQELVEAIEHSEVMHLLTGRVLDTVTSQLAVWDRQGLHCRASINVSTNDLHRPGFAEEIDAAIRKHGLEPGQLTIEITEGMLISDPGRVQRAADLVRSLGVGLSLDDFGTGYASLRQLRQLPLTEVKIDRSYISQLGDSTQRAIVVAIHQLAQLLRLDVVAEGIEDAQTVAALADLPKIIGQGWHFGRPMSAEALVQWCQDRHGPRRDGPGPERAAAT